MNVRLQSLFDRLSIGVSTACAIQCAAMPIILATFPAASMLPFDEHDFHLALMFLIVPMSLIAAALGCKKHKDKKVVAGIGAGLFLLVFTAVFGHDIVGELGEKILTIAASLILAAAHWRNYSLCRKKTCDH